MVRNLRQYSKEFKQESVSFALSYANVNQAAKELGIPGPTLHEWVTKQSLQVLVLFTEIMAA